MASKNGKVRGGARSAKGSKRPDHIQATYELALRRVVIEWIAATGKPIVTHFGSDDQRVSCLPVQSRRKGIQIPDVRGLVWIRWAIESQSYAILISEPLESSRRFQSR